MTKIIFVATDGTRYEVDAELGSSVMQAAVNAGVPGILADCGGECACGTCHAYVDHPWLDRMALASSNEREMLECVLDPRPNSRLTCQLTVGPELDQMVVQLPPSQV